MKTQNVEPLYCTVNADDRDSKCECFTIIHLSIGQNGLVSKEDINHFLVNAQVEIDTKIQLLWICCLGYKCELEYGLFSECFINLFIPQVEWIFRKILYQLESRVLIQIICNSFGNTSLDNGR